jgi:hypothetical protein
MKLIIKILIINLIKTTLYWQISINLLFSVTIIFIYIINLLGENNYQENEEPSIPKVSLIHQILDILLSF